MTLKYLHNEDPWLLGEDIPNADLFFSGVWLPTFVRDVEATSGIAYKKILTKFEGYHLWFYFGERDGYEVGEHLAKRIVDEPGFATMLNQEIVRAADKLSDFSHGIPQNDLKELTEPELWNIYETHQNVHAEYYTWCWIPVAADMFHNNLTRRVKDYLKALGVSDEKLNEYFVTLTQPTKPSLIFTEQEGLLRIAAAAEENPALKQIFVDCSTSEIAEFLTPEVRKMLEDHRANYYYTKHLWVSGEYTLEDYIAQIKEVFATGQSATDVRQRLYSELKRGTEKREALMQELGIAGQWRDVLDNFGDFMVTKIYRRYAQLLAVHHMSPILKEIARRKFLTEKQVRFMRPDEVQKLLLNDECNAEEILERTKFCVYYAERDAEKVFVGEEARELMQSIEREVDTDVSELRGETGCVGYAKGKVKIIIRADEMSKMQTGDVLVSIATDPDIVPAMKKASAIITEQGGVTSHAAIVSRELGIPCVIGTKIATRVLNDGDEVEVDANQGIVRILK